MPKKTKAPIKLRSLRSSLLHMVLIALVCVVLAVFGLFRSNMVRVLWDAETLHVREMSETLESSLGYVTGNLEAATKDWACRDETYYYLAGANPAFPEESIVNHVSLETYRCNFIIIRDAQGNLKYAYGYDFENNVELKVPQDLVQALPQVEMRLPAADFGVTGIFLFAGKAYLISSIPVTTTNAQSTPNGSFTRVSLFDEAYFQSLTKLHNSTFKLEAIKPGESTQARYHINDGSLISYYNYTQDVNGVPVRVTMTHPRSIHDAGINVVSYISLFLLLTMCAILMLLFLLIERNIIQKVRHMSRGVEGVGAGAKLDEKDYGRFRELSALGESINSMVARLEENRKEAERTEMFRTVLPNILNSMDAYLYVSDPETDQILFINDKMRKHFQLPEDVVGQVCWKVLQNGFTSRCDFCPNHKLQNDPGASVVWEEHNTVTGNIYRNVDCFIEWTQGKLVHLQHSIDITDMKQAQTALKKQLDQQELMASLSQSFITGRDDMDGAIALALRLTGEFMDINRLLLALYREDVLQYVHEWRNPRINPASKNKARLRLCETGSRVAQAFTRHEMTYYNPDNDPAVQQNASGESSLFFPVFFNDELWGILEFNQCGTRHNWTPSDINLGELIAGLFSGVVSRKHMETQLKRLSSIVESAPLFISLISDSGKYEYCNPAVMRITGYSEQELFSSGRSLIFTPEDFHRQEQEILPAIRNNGSYSFEMPLICKGGEQRMMDFSGFMLESGIAAIARDITQERQLEQDLIHAKELAEQGSMAKSDFLSRMSHEMRTPMNAIIGMTNIARSSNDPQRKEYCLDKIDNASTHLLGVINDILDMSKIEANKFELSKTNFVLERMLMNVVNVINFRIDEKEQELLIHLDPKLPFTVFGDEQRFAQVLTNLLTNAAKFTLEKGKIELSVRLHEQDEQNIILLVEVRDNGIGISKSQMERLFHSFEQADGGIARRFGGTGLGLAISKRIVELMSGEIWVESELGKGSVFGFTAKLEQGTQVIQARRDTPPQRQPNILVVDDSQDALDYFTHILEQLGMHCSTALSGAQALAMLHSANAPYEMIFIDWRMPGMNGIELAEHILRGAQNLPVIIMVSVAEWSEIEQEAARVGIQAFLPKPLFPSAVSDCIHKHFHPETPREDNPSGNYSGKYILLAEDVEINREIVLTLLEDTGVTIDIAENGRFAVETFAQQPDKYNLILMDVQMPEVDGLEATRRIRAMDCLQASNIPIVAMTANVFREDVENCLAAGMNGHLSKPLELDKLFAVLDQYISH